MNKVDPRKEICSVPLSSEASTPVSLTAWPGAER